MPLDKYVDICNSEIQLKEYLSEICYKLKCCLKMISLNEMSHDDLKSDEYATNQLCAQSKCCVLCSLSYYSTQTLTCKEISH
jgi:hypothetical protein